MKTSQSIQAVINYIIESEMKGKENKRDPYYPTILTLRELKNKTLDEESFMINLS